MSRFWNVIEQGFADFQRTPSHTTSQTDLVSQVTLVFLAVT